MKYIKQFENIDWSFDEEEEKEKGDLDYDITDYMIIYNTFDEFKGIFEKLDDMDYDIYDYKNLKKYIKDFINNENQFFISEWDGFFFDEDGEWVQSRNIDEKTLKYDDIKNL